MCCATLAGLTLALVWGGSAFAEIDLVWRVPEPVPDPQQVIDIELRAVASSANDPTIGALDAVVTWDPLHLELLGVVNNGAYAWLVSDFLADPGELNDGLADGDAVYTALATFDATASAADPGLTVTTFRFRTLRRTVSTRLAIATTLGMSSRTVVYGRDSPQHEVTGALHDAIIAIGMPGDCDGDHAVGAVDFAGVQRCYTGATGPIDPPSYPTDSSSCCPSFDFDTDGDVDLDDYSTFAALAAGPK